MTSNRQGSPVSSETLDIDLGFTVGLDMRFDQAVEWAHGEGFEFIELLLDGPYARERIADEREEMRETLSEAGVGIVVHLPFAIHPGVPFTPVREGVLREFERGMDLAVDLGAKRVVFHPSVDVWDLGYDAAERRALIHQGLDRLVPACVERGLVPCLENVVSSYYDVYAFPELFERYPDASMTFDTSHALLSGMDETAMATFCERYAEEIAHLHLVDTRGGTDEHLHPGMGRVSFERVFAGLSKADWSGTATLEVGTSHYETIALGKQHVESILFR